MRKGIVFAIATMLAPVYLYAVDGQTLINQAIVTAAGGFPYQIKQAGSYKLSGNLTVPAGLDGIDINADRVTLDLNGFTITGGGAVGFATAVLSDHSRITVKNGSVTGFFIGVALSNIGSVNGTAEQVMDVHADSNFLGISVINGIVTRCTSDSNNIGILASGSTLIQNVVQNNNSFGMDLDPHSVYGSNVIIGNGTDVAFGAGITQNNNACSSGPC